MQKAMIAALAISLGAPAGALAREVYVHPDGKNSNAGTKEAPLKNLWRAISGIQDGDTIRVAAGVYPGQSKSGIMPKIEVGNVTIEGGWNADFTERDPFKHLTIISPPGDTQGAGKTVFHFETPSNKVGNCTLDGFCIDRGPGNYYSSDGEPGANKRVEGHQDNSAWGYQAMNMKKSGSDPTVVMIGQAGGFTVRNMLIVNSPWWAIYVKTGGSAPTVVENNLVLISSSRAIEVIAGSGWGDPPIHIRNNTVAFTFGVSDGRALSVDPRKGAGQFVVEKNVFAFSDEGGVTVKFPVKGDALTLNDNTFFFNKKGDLCMGGKAVAKADDFEDELECPNEENERKLPGFVAKVGKAWFDRYSIKETDMLAGGYNTWDELKAAREVHGLGDYEIPGYDKTFPDYKSLPQKRNTYNQSRYPHPMKNGELMDWESAVLPLIGADGPRGVQAFQAGS